jgi:DNA-binding FadR family transcriptional regulator
VSALDLMDNEPAFRIYLERSVDNPSAGAHVAKVAAEHRRIYELLAAREAEEARIAMRAHIESARDNFMECLPLAGSPSMS